MAQAAGAAHTVFHFPAVKIANHVDLPTLRAELVAEVFAVAILPFVFFWLVLSRRNGRAEGYDPQMEVLRLSTLEEAIVVVGRRLRQSHVGREWNCQTWLNE